MVIKLEINSKKYVICIVRYGTDENGLDDYGYEIFNVENEVSPKLISESSNEMWMLPSGALETAFQVLLSIVDIDNN